MRNQNVRDAWAYHNSTKHSPESVRQNVHFMDWANQPLLFKIYPDLEPIPLPKDMAQSGVAALSAIATRRVPDRDVTPDLGAITSLLYFSAGVTRRRGDILFRAAACTGALYEVELYLACGELPDLAAGLYHFNPVDLSLRRLRALPRHGCAWTRSPMRTTKSTIPRGGRCMKLRRSRRRRKRSPGAPHRLSRSIR